jgi:ubiquinone/menaquinone biosynthesis C-methylase UbiE
MPESLDAIARAFDGRAATYDRNEWHLCCAERLVALAEIGPGQSVLDAACGTGMVALAVASRVGQEGCVVGVDISERMLAEAQRKASIVRASSVTFERCDVTLLRHYADASFDVVLCAAGMLYLQTKAALTEWRRLLRSGGVVGFTAMAEDEPRGASVFRTCAAEWGIRLRNPNAPLGTSARCREALVRAGFRPFLVRVERVPFGAADLEMAWESNIKSPAHSVVLTLAAADLGRLRHRYEEEMQQIWRESPTALTGADIIFAFGRA